jgi:hypothetical protein
MSGLTEGAIAEGVELPTHVNTQTDHIGTVVQESETQKTPLQALPKEMPNLYTALMRIFAYLADDSVSRTRLSGPEAISQRAYATQVSIGNTHFYAFTVIQAVSDYRDVFPPVEQGTPSNQVLTKLVDALVVPHANNMGVTPDAIHAALNRYLHINPNKMPDIVSECDQFVRQFLRPTSQATTYQR